MLLTHHMHNAKSHIINHRYSIWQVLSSTHLPKEQSKYCRKYYWFAWKSTACLKLWFIVTQCSPNPSDTCKNTKIRRLMTKCIARNSSDSHVEDMPKSVVCWVSEKDHLSERAEDPDWCHIEQKVPMVPLTVTVCITVTFVSHDRGLLSPSSVTCSVCESTQGQMKWTQPFPNEHWLKPKMHQL